MAGQESYNPADNVQHVHSERNFVCYECDGTDHKPTESRARDKKCNNDNKVGYFARVCRSAEYKGHEKGNSTVRKAKIIKPVWLSDRFGSVKKVAHLQKSMCCSLRVKMTVFDEY